jgi:hypothetical protein
MLQMKEIIGMINPAIISRDNRITTTLTTLFSLTLKSLGHEPTLMQPVPAVSFRFNPPDPH